ncbi:MAG: cupin-like domain-containing protein [Bacteroidia bacterium]
MRITRTIDTVEYISPGDFMQLYFKPQKPLIIKNFAGNTPAGKHWTIEYLKRICGDVTVDIFDSENKNSKSSAYTKADKQMCFSDYASILEKNESSSFRIFLFNMFRHKPELRKDFPCPGIFKGILGRVGYMFFGSKGTKVRIHQDIDMSSVLLTQFHGRKKVKLIAPKYSALLYRLPFNTYSLIDPEKPDLDKYPALEFVEAQECVLEPGDTLFMPGGYWHYITYLDGGFAVSYRKLSPGLKMKLKGVVSLLVHMPIDKALNLMFKDKWLMKKEELARANATKAMVKILLESENPYSLKDISHI